MTKVVINTCFGGFSLSKEAIILYLEKKNIQYRIESERFLDSFYITESGKEEYFFARDIKRTDLVLIQVVEELEEKANGASAYLLVEEIPTGTKYRITEYDGLESIETADEIDWEIA